MTSLHSLSGLQFRAGMRSILGNGAWLMGVGWVEAGLAGAYLALMARWLGPAQYGQWAYGIAAYTLTIGLANFGLETLLLLRLGRDQSNAADTVGLNLAFRIGALCLGAAGLVVYALGFEPDPVNRLVLLIFTAALVGRGGAMWARVCFLGFERMADYARYAALFRAAEAACGIAYLVSGGGLLGVVIIHTLSWTGEAGFGLWRIRSRLTGYALRLAWRPAMEMLSQGAVLGAAAAAYTWLTAGPIMLLRHTGLAMAQIGQFAIVASAAMILVGSVHSFAAAALPVLSRTVQQSFGGMAYGRLTALAIAAAALAAAVIAQMLGPAVAQWLLGPKYALAGGLLGPFLLIGGAILLPTGYEQVMLVSGLRWPGAVAAIAGGVFLAASLIPAVAIWGINGAVLATACAWLLRAAVVIAVAETFALRAHRVLPIPTTEAVVDGG